MKTRKKGVFLAFLLAFTLFVSFGFADYPDCAADTVDGIWIVSANTTISNFQNCLTITVSNNSVLTLNSSAAGNVSIELRAENITVVAGSSISVIGYSGGANASNGTGPGRGMGHINAGGGAGFGGSGGSGNSGGAGGSSYGGLTWPVNAGSGGGGGSVAGGPGGGAIFINASSTVIINGSVITYGIYGSGGIGSGGGGGGSGGSILIITPSLFGNGIINASGGSGGGGGTRGGGGGSGGRIAVYSLNDSFTGSRIVSGGAGGSASWSGVAGAAGTIVFCSDLNCFGSNSSVLNSSYLGISVVSSFSRNSTLNFTRKLTSSWNVSSMRWNDTANSDLVVSYNIFGLLPNTAYYVFDNGYLFYSGLMTNAQGNLQSFNLTGFSVHSIEITNSSCPSCYVVSSTILNSSSNGISVVSSISRNFTLNFSRVTSGSWNSNSIKWNDTLGSDLIWNASSMRWNDTPGNTFFIFYNISGLLPNTAYYVFDNRYLFYSVLMTDANGNLPLFNLTGFFVHSIEVTNYNYNYPSCWFSRGDGVWNVTTNASLVYSPNLNISYSQICKSITVSNNSVLTLNSSAAGNVSIELRAENITVVAGSSISVIGYSGGANASNGTGPGRGMGKIGYGGGGGAGFGGSGGSGNSGGAGGSSYGGLTWPVNAGSGGGGASVAGGPGGGAIFINASNIVIINGSIIVNGINGFGGTYGGGGGSGGSILIITPSLFGNGIINACGGSGGGGATLGGGGGSGGRIAVYSLNDSFTGSRIVSGGAGGSASWSGVAGAAGTIVFCSDLNCSVVSSSVLNSSYLGISVVSGLSINSTLTFIRKLTSSWNNTSLLWNDTTSISSLNISYSISGLQSNFTYYVKDNNVSLFNLTTNATGVLPQFNLTGNVSHSIMVYVVPAANVNITVNVSPNSPITYGTNSIFSCSANESVPVTLYINSINMTSENGTSLVRAADTYIVNCSWSGNSTYAANWASTTYLINEVIVVEENIVIVVPSPEFDFSLILIIFTIGTALMLRKRE